MEQSTPTPLIVDNADVSVSSIVFVDKDLDEMEVGGDIYWDMVVSDERVVTYHVYLADGVAGPTRSQVAQAIPVGTQESPVLEDTAIGISTHVLVYTKSALVEQSTPVYVALSDTISLIPDSSFPDQAGAGGAG